MRIWPWRRRRRANRPINPIHDSAEPKQPLTEKPLPPRQPPPSRNIEPPPTRHLSSRGTSHRVDPPPSQVHHPPEPPQPASSANEPRNFDSKEDVTALPAQVQLQRSPHLRPADITRPQIPYNFRPYSTSQTSVQRHEALAKLTKSNTHRSRRDTTENILPARRFSTRSKRDTVREEEIRCMTTPIPIPKRLGDGPLRRDSKKSRGLNGDSHVSLPPEGSVHSTMSMSGIELRGWEVGNIAAVFKPRPAVRLSGLPQYVSSSLPPSSAGYLCRVDSIRAKGKRHTKDDADRLKRRTVGEEADLLDSGDIRAIMERDAKRKEQREIDRQARLERKLRSAGRDRADSERRRRHSDERKRVEHARALIEQELQSRGVLTPPSDVHPALRSASPVAWEPVGLGIEEGTPPVEDSEPSSAVEADPFADVVETLEPPQQLPTTSFGPASSTILEEPMEESYGGGSHTMRMSMTNTPPLSPIYGQRAASSSHLAEIARLERASQPSLNDLLPPPRIPVERRSSDPPSEKRSGTWASFFRRTSTIRKSMQDPKGPREASSFSNTSRESMRHQPLPAHLAAPEAPRSPSTRSASGTPTRTQSKFREDLPEMPISPPDSRQQSPDVTTAAAAAATARRSARAPTQPVDIPGRLRDVGSESSIPGRNDTPVSTGGRGHVAMAASLASIDSEGSWLASGGSKRQSMQSALSRSFGKLNAEFTNSYEELGVDRDAEYFDRNKPSRGKDTNLPDAFVATTRNDDSGDDESLPEATIEDPLTVHGSVRKKPILVQRDARLVSQEGLIQQYATQEAIEQPDEAGNDLSTPYDSPEDGSLHTPEHTTDEDDGDLEASPQVQGATEIGRAKSVSMDRAARHSRQYSAGSARLLNVPARRQSTDTTPLSSAPLSRSTTPNP